MKRIIAIALMALMLTGCAKTERAEEAYRRGYEEGQSDIILCKDCVKHNKGHGRYLDGTVIGIKDCCPLVEIRGIAQGHEFDYQYCAYAERKTDERQKQRPN